jgi:AraC family transcriptional regulator
MRPMDQRTPSSGRLARSIAPAPSLAARQWSHAVARSCREPARVDGFITPAVEVHQIVMAPSAGFRVEAREVGTSRWHTHDVAPGELYVIGAGGAPHELCWRSLNRGNTFDLIELYLDPQTSNLLEEGVMAPTLAPHWRVLSDPLLRQLLLQLNRALPLPDSTDELFGEVATQLFALQLGRAHAQPGEAQHIRRSGLTPLALRRVREFIATHLKQSIRLEQLASVAGLSSAHFSRAFKSSTGLSPHAYVVRCRLEEAKRLLAGTTVPISEVARRSGFSGPSQLSTRFRAITKQTPSSYRQLARR